AGRSGVLVSGSVVHNDDFIDDNGDGFSDLTLDTRVSLFGRAALRRGGRRIGHVSAKLYYEDRFGGVEEWTPAHRGSDEVYGESIRTDRYELVGAVEGPWADTRAEVSASFHRQDSWYGDSRFAADQTIAFGRFVWDPPRRDSRHDLVVGAALTHDVYDDDTPATARADRRWIPGVFVEDQVHVDEAVTVLGGLRADHHARHGVILSPRASVMWRPTAAATFRLNAGTGFRVVHLFTEDHAALTGARDVVIDGALEPERSASLAFNYNQVVEFGTNPMMVDVDAFYTRFTNRIVPDYDADPNQIVYANLDGRRSVTRGVSVALNQNFGTSLPLFYSVGFTIQDVVLEGGGEPTEDEFFAAEYRGVWSLSYEFRPGFTLDYAGSLTGPMRLPEFGGEFARPTRNDPYATHDAQFSWAWSPGRQITLGVRNLTDFTQPSPLIDPARPFGDAFDTSYVYGPIVGRRISLGVRYTRGR
ncbi:MAG: TonB-dependent receptor, partial [Longimicrobiales bacterium]